MTDNYPMGALSPTCKPDDADDADITSPLVLLPPQAAISVEIADNGDVILRQECALGGDPDQIVIARANLPAFLEALVDIMPHERGRYDVGGSRDDLPAQGAKCAPTTSARRTPAAERQARCRARKLAAATGGPLQSNWSPLDTGATSTPDRSTNLAPITPGAAKPAD